VSWQYMRGNGSPLTTIPSFIAGISARVGVNNSDGDIKSTPLPASTTTFDLVAAGYSPPEWNLVNGITFQYTDITGNLYEQQYNKVFSVQIQPQLEHTYVGYITGCNTSAGCVNRELNLFVNVPSGTVNRLSCPDPFGGSTGGQTAPPYFVQIQNHNAVLGFQDPTLPFNNETCVSYNGTSTFNNSSQPIDFFGVIVDLDNPAPAYGSGVLSVPLGTQFDISISTNPLNAGANRSTLVTSIQVPEATAADVINMSGPTGFTLAAAKLGQAQTIFWTKPSFPVRDLFVNPNVYTSSTGGNAFCSVQNNALSNLDPAATQATFTLPTTCNGQAVQQANVCVFYTGDQGQTSLACWFWSNQPAP
jgi:hypothetical protein